VADAITLTWRCQRCGTLHVDDSSRALRCRCGTEWCPFRAPREEVDEYMRGMGLDPEATRAEGRAIARRAMEVSRGK
jgi:hypothetical protein